MYVARIRFCFVCSGCSACLMLFCVSLFLPDCLALLCIVWCRRKASAVGSKRTALGAAVEPVLFVCSFFFVFAIERRTTYSLWVFFIFQCRREQFLGQAYYNSPAYIYRTVRRGGAFVLMTRARRAFPRTKKGRPKFHRRSSGTPKLRARILFASLSMSGRTTAVQYVSVAPHDVTAYAFI